MNERWSAFPENEAEGSNGFSVQRETSNSEASNALCA